MQWKSVRIELKGPWGRIATVTNSEERFHPIEPQLLHYKLLRRIWQIWRCSTNTNTNLQIQTRSLKRGRGAARVTTTRRELPSPAIQPVGNDQLVRCTSTWQLVYQSAGPLQSSLEINFWYLCCKLIYNVTLQLVKPNQHWGSMQWLQCTW